MNTARLVRACMLSILATAASGTTGCGEQPYAPKAASFQAPTLLVKTLDSDENPVPGVWFELRNEGTAKQLQTNEHGVAEVHKVPLGAYTVTVLEDATRAPLFVPLAQGNKSATITEHVTAVEGETAELVLALPSTGRLSVEVATEGFDEPPSGGFFTLRRRAGEAKWVNLASAPKARLVNRGESTARYEFDAVPTGEYEVRLNPRGRVLANCRMTVRAGQVTSCSLGPLTKGLSLSFSYAGVVPSASKVGPYVRLQLSRWDHSDSDVAHAHFSEAQRSTSVSGLRTGRYVALLRPAKLAMLVDVKEGAAPVSLAPPAEGVASGGDRTLTVETHREGKPLHRLLVCLVPRGAKAQHGQWMRFTAALTVARFEGVPAGEHEIWVFDGTQGGFYGFTSNPLRREVTLSKDTAHVVIDG